MYHMNLRPGANIALNKWKTRKRANLCLNISATLNYIELLHFDAQKGVFKTVASEEFYFDPATRDLLDDLAKFKTVIKNLFEQNHVPFGMPTNLVVPSFFTRQFTVPQGVSEDEIKIILMTEAERFYVFKKIDPEIGFIHLNDQETLYTAYPKAVLQSMLSALNDLRIPVDLIDCSYTAALRGLVSMGIVTAEIDANVQWGLLLLSDYNLFMAVMESDKILKAQEVPLSLQSSDLSAMLAEVSNDFQQFFSLEVLNRMIVVNNATKLMSTDMMHTLGFKGQLDVYEQNDMTLASRGIIQDAPFPCTLEAVGGAMTYVVPEIPILNLNPLSSQNQSKWLLYQIRTYSTYILSILGALILIGQYAIGLFLDNDLKGVTNHTDQLRSSASTPAATGSLVPEIKRKLYIKTVREENIKVHNQLITLFTALPPDAWLDNITMSVPADNKVLQLQINGGTLSSDPLNTYISELNKQTGTPALVPTVIPQQKGAQHYFQFSFSNLPTTGP